MAILTVGIDLAKNVFALHRVNEAGKAELLRPAVPRDKLHELIAALPPCVIGMEACSGAHHWARLFQTSGHTVRLIAPRFVTPYRMTGKNDAADAAAICEAIQRPHMRFVPIKNLDQQSRLLVHRARQGFFEQRTATLNRIRGGLSEFDIVLPLKASTVRRRACECLVEYWDSHQNFCPINCSFCTLQGCTGLPCLPERARPFSVGNACVNIQEFVLFMRERSETYRVPG